MTKPKKPKKTFTEQEFEEWKRQRELRPNGKPDKTPPPSPQQKFTNVKKVKKKPLQGRLQRQINNLI